MTHDYESNRDLRYFPRWSFLEEPSNPQSYLNGIHSRIWRLSGLHWRYAVERSSTLQLYFAPRMCVPNAVWSMKLTVFVPAGTSYLVEQHSACQLEIRGNAAVPFGSST